MPESRVQLGELGSYVYLGVEPPLNKDQITLLGLAAEAKRLPKPFVSFWRSPQSVAHSEMGFPKMRFGEGTDQAAHQGLNTLASLLEEILNNSGIQVEIDPDIHDVGLQHQLFADQPNS